MPVTRADLIAAYPEFDDAARFPEAQITFWLDEAQKWITADQFGNRFTLAVILFVAHHIALSAQAVRSAKAGGPVGSGGGLVASKSIDKVSVSYDVATTAMQGAGPWNTTTYGQRYFQIIRSLMTGPIYRAPLPRGRYLGLGRL